jgi:glycosyltransferase involved in cell wall biosynthesis
MRIAFCCSEMTGYMAACCKQLAQYPTVELTVLMGKSGTFVPYEFHHNFTAGLKVVTLDPEAFRDTAALQKAVTPLKPDIVCMDGWNPPGYQGLPFVPALSSARFILCVDNPRKDTWRQKLGRLKLGRFLDRMDCVVVPGERAWQLTRLLKIAPSKVRRCLYAIDLDLFSPVYEKRKAKVWPSRFVYVGIYNAIKGIDILLQAYREYRKSVPDPWPLTCCGRGEMSPLVSAEPGVEDRGFVQPSDLPAILADSGVFVITSRMDHWPLALVEAAAAGLPLLSTDTCGSTVEVLRHSFNGIVAPSEDIPAIAAGFRWLHRHYADLPEMGLRSRTLAAPYSSQLWAKQWVEIFEDLLTSE